MPARQMSKRVLSSGEPRGKLRHSLLNPGIVVS